MKRVTATRAQRGLGLRPQFFQGGSSWKPSCVGRDQRGGWSGLVGAFTPSFKTKGFSFRPSHAGWSRWEGVPWPSPAADAGFLEDAPEAAAWPFFASGARFSSE